MESSDSVFIVVITVYGFVNNFLELALALFLLADKIEDARQLSKRMPLEFRALIDRFCKIPHLTTFIDYFLDKLDDEFLISSNLSMKFFNDGSFEIHSTEKKGLSVLFELHKCQDTEIYKKYCHIYVNYLMDSGATYLALFFMKTLSSFNKVTTDLALNNAISILSKVEIK